MKTEKDDAVLRQLDIRQLAIKLCANSMCPLPPPHPRTHTPPRRAHVNVCVRSALRATPRYALTPCTRCRARCPCAGMAAWGTCTRGSTRGRSPSSPRCKAARFCSARTPSCRAAQLGCAFLVCSAVSADDLACDGPVSHLVPFSLTTVPTKAHPHLKPAFPLEARARFGMTRLLRTAGWLACGEQVRHHDAQPQHGGGVWRH